MSAAYDPQRWETFYVMTGGAAAALTGLLFVAMSLHSKQITAHPLYGGRAVGTLVSLMTQLFLAGAVLVPGQSVTAIGVEVLVAALYFLVTTWHAIRRLRSATVAHAQSRRRRAIELSGASIWMVLFVASGVSLITQVGGGFYVLAVVMLFMFGWNVYVAWVLITEIAD